jgi:membrane-associated phospholipid phosphatase
VSVTAAAVSPQEERKILPHGWGDLFLQIGLWFGFLAAYQVARGVADRNAATAFENGLKVIDIESRANSLFELSLQRLVDSSQLLAVMTSWTYWLSQFTVLGLSLLWVYVWRNDVFPRFRTVIILANVIGLAGYVLLPTAPPRMFPDVGFVDTLANFASLNHGSGLIQLASNPYAAMPSLHSADSLIVGLIMASLVTRWWAKALWLAWAPWVWFSVMATGNHFWLDIAAGVHVAAIAALVLERRRLLRFI